MTPPFNTDCPFEQVPLYLPLEILPELEVPEVEEELEYNGVIVIDYDHDEEPKPNPGVIIFDMKEFYKKS